MPDPGAGCFRVTCPAGRSPDCAVKVPRSALCGVLARRMTQAMVPEGSAFGRMPSPRSKHQMVVWFGGLPAGLPGAVRVAEPSGTETSVGRLSGWLTDRTGRDAVLGRCSKVLLGGNTFQRIGQARRCLRTDLRQRWENRLRTRLLPVFGSLRAKKAWKRSISGMTDLRARCSRKRTAPGTSGPRAWRPRAEPLGEAIGNQLVQAEISSEGSVGRPTFGLGGRIKELWIPSLDLFIDVVFRTAIIGQNGFGHGSPGIGNIFGRTGS